ncbi:methylamine dehydrogenase light chain [Halomonas marinisediminis]|uniref:Methylamine dehydrogenase n=1 Tax=Halomonas marinisediminis TaxID=2546095 RepID=A0ABY2D9G4_9GAMM|nr:methylamine dehydrogenase light chain [Halomonas marinisediminis]TDB04675.1 methylamine dehydrogenase [Halomonas marinisediminis]
MSLLDRFFERTSRRVAHSTSRRNTLFKLGSWMVAGSALPLILPIDRSAGNAHAAEKGEPGDPGDPTSCDYWRYCSIDGYLCSCCGGSKTSCPPGTDISRVAWVGTCRNPADGRDYIISYNDCCGNQPCGKCACNRNDSEQPIYRPFNNNDINWCIGAESNTYVCTITVIQGVAT